MILSLALILAASDVPDSLVTARKLTDQLRYEEAVVEYERYLGLPERPNAERAKALFELAFIHLLLGDEVTARMRGTAAIEADAGLRLPPDAPPKQRDFFELIRAEHGSRPRLEVLPGDDADAPQRIHARLADPKRRVSAVFVRHSLGKTGPFHATRMACAADGQCAAEIPAPIGVEAWTAWYYVEANDPEGNTLALAANASAPLRVSVVSRAPWYQSPWIWAGSAAALIAAGALVYVTSTPTR